MPEIIIFNLNNFVLGGVGYLLFSSIFQFVKVLISLLVILRVGALGDFIRLLVLGLLVVDLDHLDSAILNFVGEGVF